MGLAEKRAISEAQKSWVPQRKAEIKELTGADIPYEFDWDSFADDAKAVNWLEHNGPQQLAMALRVICRDDLGKEAVVGTVKKVVFKNVKDAAARKATLSGGTLEIHGAFAEGIPGTVRDAGIREYLEKQL
jgi:hypothetical protein